MCSSRSVTTFASPRRSVTTSPSRHQSSPRHRLQEPLFLEVLLRARMQLEAVTAEERVVDGDEVTLRERDVAGVLVEHLGDLVGEVRADLGGRRHDAGEYRQGEIGRA